MCRQDAARVVFASRHGELRRTTDILRAISAGEPVSPTAFSLSVLNAMTGVFGIARGDRSAASAISAGAETLGYALLEAHAQYATQPDSPLLLVYADEPADPAYGTIEDEVQGGAIAILLDSETATGELVCTVSRTDQPESEPTHERERKRHLGNPLRDPERGAAALPGNGPARRLAKRRRHLALELA